MDNTPTAVDTDQGQLTIADIYATRGKNPDPTGDFAAGRTHVHLSTEEFIACLTSELEEDLDR